MSGPTGLKNGTESGLFQTLAQLVANTSVKAATTVTVFELANRGDYYVSATNEGGGVALDNGLFANKLASGGGSGEVNTASNIGTGAGLFAGKSGVDLRFKTLKTIGAATVTSDADSVTIDVTAAGGGDMLASVYDPQNIAADAFDRANHTGSQAISTVTSLQTALDNKLVNVTNGATTGESLASRPAATTDVFVKRLKAGANVTLSSDAESVTISATSGGGGEANTASNIGTGVGLFAQKSGVDLQFKSLKILGSSTLTTNADSVTIVTPTLAAVATTGSYNDLTGKPLNWVETSQNIGSTTGAVSVVIASGAYIKATSTGNTTWTFDTTGLAANQVAAWTIMLTNGGSFTQTFTGAKWGDGAPPTTLGTGLSRLVFTYDGTDLIGTVSDKGIA